MTDKISAYSTAEPVAPVKGSNSNGVVTDKSQGEAAAAGAESPQIPGRGSEDPGQRKAAESDQPEGKNGRRIRTIHFSDDGDEVEDHRDSDSGGSEECHARQKRDPEWTLRRRHDETWGRSYRQKQDAHGYGGHGQERVAQ